MGNDLETAKDNLDQKQTAFEQAAKELDEANEKHRTARTATFDQDTVQQARNLGVNPDNFDTEYSLKNAVAIRQAEQPEPAQPATPAPAASAPGIMRGRPVVPPAAVTPAQPAVPQAPSARPVDTTPAAQPAQPSTTPVAPPAA